MRLRIARGVVLAAVLLAALPVSALAQGPCPGVSRAYDQVLRDAERVRERIASCAAPEGEKLARTAVDRLRDCAAFLERGDCRRAEMQLRAAKGLLDRAIRLCDEGDPYRDRLLVMLEKTDAMLADAAAGAGAADTACRRFLDAGRRQQENALRHYRSGNYRLALTLTLSARELADRVLRCRGGDRTDGDALAGVLDRTDRLLAEVRRVVAEAPDAGPALDLLGEADRLQSEARRVAASGRRPLLAASLTEQARALASRALAAVEVDLDAAAVEPMVGTTAALLDKLGEAAAEAGDPVATDLVRRARRLVDEARAALAAGDVREGWARLRAGSALALEASARLGVGGDR